MKRLLAGSLAFTSLLAFGRTVSTGTFVTNPGVVVSVPLSADDLSGVGAATFALNYDMTIVSCLGVEAGDTVAAAKMTYADTGAGQVILVISEFQKEAGIIARVRLLVRPGTQGLYSDVTIAEADFAARDGLTDSAVGDPVTTVNGMIRVAAPSADVTRLENAFVVSPKTVLKTLSLSLGDSLMASDDRAAIAITQGVAAHGVIAVEPPLNGWCTGTYAILSTPTPDLHFQFSDLTNVTVRTVPEDGRITYYADVVADDELSLMAEKGLIPFETEAQIRNALTDELAAHPEVKSIIVKGEAALIPVIVDLGIAPSFDVMGTTATICYTQPSIKITAFDPVTGNVRIKITPGEGNAIRTMLTTGCIHVYGTSDLSQKMRYIGGTAIDITPYLKEESEGEADLVVTMGTHTFIKVKAETLNKQEGDQE